MNPEPEETGEDRPPTPEQSVRPAQRLTGPGAELFIADDPTFMRGQRFPIEVWQLSDGDRVAIVSHVVGNAPLGQVVGQLLTAVTARWAPCRLLAHWPRHASHRSGRGPARYAWLGRAGTFPVDLAELARRGLDLRS